MTNNWYELVPASAALTQGDIILACPIVVFKRDTEPTGKASDLAGMVQAEAVDVIVMTQACDLHNNKVDNVILCPQLTLEQYRADWLADYDKRLSKPVGKGANELNKWRQQRTSKWKDHCNKIRSGWLWNYSMLNAGEAGGMNTGHRIVDFHEVYTIPVVFLQKWLESEQQQRLRLLPPYREHLSQAFARYFMRVGLPLDVEPIWNEDALPD